ncbi:glutamine and serine-rich protein 1 [Esox lucius]|uniref:glutamine and serine-rich protein 1 n=1 Tax=Esox lucius TaxID=8010 RepID=UPI0014773FD8|nr:glutamine and serine-rich protein 1 [Esox lucius]
MMDRNYPTSSFTDPLAQPTQTVAWAYERSPASIKPSYGVTHLESELLHRQTYVSTQLPTYTTTHHPTSLSGVFDSGGNTAETSVMNFLSAIESRALQQAGPVGASVPPPFRTPTWQTGANSTTELFLTGALPSTATFPSPATLSSYQHTGAFASRSYTTTPSLALHDPAFSTSTNGLLSPHHDPLLQLKPSQTTLPTSLAFDRLPTPSLGAALPPQSSTYRSAQESAPHLLQPQFGLLPLATQQAPQPYGVPVFSGSIERALQRECSVIKHHQRPSSSSHTASEPGSQHSMQAYLGSGSEDGDVSFQQDPSRQTPVPCSPSTGSDSSHGVNGAAQTKTGGPSHTYSSSIIPSPSGYSSSSAGAKTKDCSSKLNTGGQEGHPHSQDSPESYPSPGQKQGSVIASQQTQPYTSAQLPSLLSTLSHSQSYINSQAYSSSDKLPSLYKTLPSLSGHSGNVVSVSQSLVYSSSPGHGQGNEGQYGAQIQGLCLGNPSQTYPSSHSQGAPNVSYPSQSQGQASVSQSQSYATGQSLSSSYPSPRTQSLPTPNSSQGYTPFSSAPHVQALENNCRSSIQDLKPAYGKMKLEGEIPLQDLQALQQNSLETSSSRGSTDPTGHNNVVYVVSKMDDRYNTQSVIRSNSRSEDPLMGPKTSTNAQLMSSHAAISAEEIKRHSLLLKRPEPQQENHQAHAHSAQNQTQYIRVPNSEPNRDLQMILLQQPLIYSGHNSSKMQQISGPSQGQVQYLQMEGDHLTSVSGSQSQQGAVGQNPITDSSKQHLSSPKDPYSQSNSQQQDAKHHFALSSICFPESMLMADERNILSNVDDILAATAAACGVTPQDFVKATSGTSEGDMSDAKGHFQPLDTRHQSHNFSVSSSQQSIISNTNSHNTMALTLNGTHMTSDEEGHLGQQYAMSLSHTTIVNSTHDVGASKSLLQTSGDEQNQISLKGQPVQHADSNPNGGHSENDYHLSGQGYDPLGQLGRGQAKNQIHKGIKREDSLVECLSDSFPNPKKRVRSKASAKPSSPEGENGQPRKKTVQTKRQASRGSDPTSSPSTSEVVYDSYQQQERMRQKIREVEEQQPEVKTGFIGSFLDFLKSGPKQQFSSPPIRTPSRSRKPSASSKHPPCPVPLLPPKIQSPSAPLMNQDIRGIGLGGSGQQQQKRLDEEFQRNLETLPSFSSDEDESSTRKNQALQNSISSALSALDEPSDRRPKSDNRLSSSLLKADQAPSMPHSSSIAHEQQTAAPMESSATGAPSPAVGCLGQEVMKPALPGLLAFQLSSVAIEGLTDEELSDSGGEGMYRERDEFVVKNEDMESLKVTLTAGQEPPAIWKVQKALLQKFVPELRDSKRVFSATNSYLGYFGDAKTMYRRVYVKFLDTVNKREYVRVCNRKPRCKPMHSLRGSQAKTLLGLKTSPPCDPLTTPTSLKLQCKPRPKQPKIKAEPPPKKRRKWKEEYSPSPSDSSSEEVGENEEFPPVVPFASRFLNTRTMKETFKSFVELLISVALDADVMSTLERETDELLLPHMRRVDEMISDNRRRLLPRLRVGQLFKTALDSFPEISVVTELKKDGETPAFKVRLSGKAYNRKNMKPSKSPSQLPLEYTVDQQKTQWFSLYHSLQHYKYHTYLMCKDEIASLRLQTGDMGQEETVQLCMRNGAWVEGLFDRFGELLNQVQQACL